MSSHDLTRVYTFLSAMVYFPRVGIPGSLPDILRHSDELNTLKLYLNPCDYRSITIYKHFSESQVYSRVVGSKLN